MNIQPLNSYNFLNIAPFFTKFISTESGWKELHDCMLKNQNWATRILTFSWSFSMAVTGLWSFGLERQKQKFFNTPVDAWTKEWSSIMLGSSQNPNCHGWCFENQFGTSFLQMVKWGCNEPTILFGWWNNNGQGEFFGAFGKFWKMAKNEVFLRVWSSVGFLLQLQGWFDRKIC